MTGVFLASFMVMEWEVSWRYRLALINNITKVHRLAASRGVRGVLIVLVCVDEKMRPRKHACSQTAEC